MIKQKLSNIKVLATSFKLFKNLAFFPLRYPSQSSEVLKMKVKANKKAELKVLIT